MTRYFSFLHSLGIAISLVGCSSSDIIACDPQGCISEQTFLNSIVSNVQNLQNTPAGVAGYVVYVGGLPPVSSGLCRFV
jgi:hypothetical protein